MHCCHFAPLRKAFPTAKPNYGPPVSSCTLLPEVLNACLAILPLTGSFWAPVPFAIVDGAPHVGCGLSAQFTRGQFPHLMQRQASYRNFLKGRVVPICTPSALLFQFRPVVAVPRTGRCRVIPLCVGLQGFARLNCMRRLYDVRPFFQALCKPHGFGNSPLLLRQRDAVFTAGFSRHNPPLPLLGRRIGEAAHPGPQADIRSFFQCHAQPSTLDPAAATTSSVNSEAHPAKMTHRD